MVAGQTARLSQMWLWLWILARSSCPTTQVSPFALNSWGRSCSVAMSQCEEHKIVAQVASHPR